MSEKFFSGDTTTSREKVVGGWLYVTYASAADEAGCASTFVPDDGLTGRRVQMAVPRNGMVDPGVVLKVQIGVFDEAHGFYALVKLDEPDSNGTRFYTVRVEDLALIEDGAA